MSGDCVRYSGQADDGDDINCSSPTTSHPGQGWGPGGGIKARTCRVYNLHGEIITFKLQQAGIGILLLVNDCWDSAVLEGTLNTGTDWWDPIHLLI